MKTVIESPSNLEDALLSTGFGLHNISSMLLSGVTLMGMIMQTLGFSFIVPAAQCDLDLSPQQKTWLMALPFIAIILTLHMWGWLADTRGRRTIIRNSCAISVFFTIVSSFAPNLISFAVLSFLAYIFISGPSGITYTYLAEMNSLRHKDKMVVLGSTFIGIGCASLPAVSWLILPLKFAYPIPFLGIEYRPWRLLVVALSAPYFISSIWFTFVDESPKYLYSRSKYDETMNVLSNMYRWNKLQDPKDFPIKSLQEHENFHVNESNSFLSVLKSMKDQTKPLFKAPLLKWTCLVCFVTFGLFATSNGFAVWFPMMLNTMANYEGQSSFCEILSSSATTNATNLTQCDDTVNTSTFFVAIVVGLALSIMYIFISLFIGILGKKNVLIIVLGLTGCCGIMTQLVQDQNVAVILFALLQMCGACIGTVAAVVVDLYPTEFRATAVCLSMLVGRIGSVVGSNLIGLLLYVRCSTSFYLFGGLLVVCSALCCLLPGKQKFKEAKLNEKNHSEKYIKKIDNNLSIIS